MSHDTSRGTSASTALVPQKFSISFATDTVFIRREKQEDFPEMEFRAGRAYGVYNQDGKLLDVYGGDHRHAFEGAELDGYIPKWMH